MKQMMAMVAQEFHLQMRCAQEWVALVLFFLVVTLLLPFAVGPEPELLQRLAPGLVWLAVLLMSLLSLERLFVRDARDGTLDMLLLSPMPLPLVVLAKLLAQIGMMLVALIAMLAPAALLLNMRMSVIPVMALTFLLGVPTLVLLGGVMSAITVALHRSAAMLTILLVPFYIPVMIFAMGACDAVMAEVSPMPNLLLLAALLALTLPTAPLFIAAALREA